MSSVGSDSTNYNIPPKENIPPAETTEVEVNLQFIDGTSKKYIVKAIGQIRTSTIEQIAKVEARTRTEAEFLTFQKKRGDIEFIPAASSTKPKTPSKPVTPIVPATILTSSPNISSAPITQAKPTTPSKPIISNVPDTTLTTPTTNISSAPIAQAKPTTTKSTTSIPSFPIAIKYPKKTIEYTISAPSDKILEKLKALVNSKSYDLEIAFLTDIAENGGHCKIGMSRKIDPEKSDQPFTQDVKFSKANPITYSFDYSKVAPKDRENFFNNLNLHMFADEKEFFAEMAKIKGVQINRILKPFKIDVKFSNKFSPTGYVLASYLIDASKVDPKDRESLFKTLFLATTKIYGDEKELFAELNAIKNVSITSIPCDVYQLLVNIQEEEDNLDVEDLLSTGIKNSGNKKFILNVDYSMLKKVEDKHNEINFLKKKEKEVFKNNEDVNEFIKSLRERGIKVTEMGLLPSSAAGVEQEKPTEQAEVVTQDYENVIAPIIRETTRREIRPGLEEIVPIKEAFLRRGDTIELSNGAKHHFLIDKEGLSSAELNRLDAIIKTSYDSVIEFIKQLETVIKRNKWKKISLDEIE